MFLTNSWLRKSRKYESINSVASSYDSWTNDRLLENLWGEHIHLGYYERPRLKKDFRKAKIDFVHQLVRWSGLNKLPKGSRVLDVGCGIGGSSRILSDYYGFNVVGISISSEQIIRANELTINTSPYISDKLSQTRLINSLEDLFIYITKQNYRSLRLKDLRKFYNND